MPCATAIDAIAKKVLLPPEEVQLWLEHLKTVSENRKQGAKKAAATRHKSRSSEYYCSVCSQKFLKKRRKNLKCGSSASIVMVGYIGTVEVSQISPSIFCFMYVHD